MYREHLDLNMRLAVIVNPDAGLGGRLGFKGSDGRAAEARAAGAQDRAGPRMRQCLEKLSELAREPIEIVAWDGRICLLYTSPSPRDGLLSRMPSSA